MTKTIIVWMIVMSAVNLYAKEYLYRSMPGEKAMPDGKNILSVQDGRKEQLFSLTTQGIVQIEEVPHEAISICHNDVHDVPRQAYYVDAWFGSLEDVEWYENRVHDCVWGFAVSVEGKDSEARNICDKGWDYEMGFSFIPAEVEQALYNPKAEQAEINIFAQNINKH
jgi:hypothetical protein